MNANAIIESERLMATETKSNETQVEYLWDPYQESHYSWYEKHNYVDPDDSGYDDDWKEWN